MLNLFQGVLSGFGRTRVLRHALEDQFKCILILEKNIVILKKRYYLLLQIDKIEIWRDIFPFIKKKLSYNYFKLGIDGIRLARSAKTIF